MNAYLLWIMATLAGCDGAFGLEHVDPPIDASTLGDGNRGDARHDAGSNSSDAGSFDATQTLVTLREAADDTNAGATDECSGTFTSDESYARVFPLTSAFAVTSITFVAAMSTNAHDLAIRIGSYAGAVGAATLDTAAITWRATAAYNYPATNTPIAVPIAATITPPDSLIVEIASPSYATGGGSFILGGAAGTQTEPSYFESITCSIEPPTDEDPRGAPHSVGSFIIDVTGYE